MNESMSLYITDGGHLRSTAARRWATLARTRFYFCAILRYSVLMFIAFIMLFVASPHAATAAAITVTDTRGHTVSLAAPAKRIVTLAPHAAELVFAAGAGAQLVAVSEHSDAPPAARALPIVGNAYALDFERIAALKPDLIVAPLHLPSTHRQALRALHIALYTADAPTPEAIADDIEALGILSGHAAAAHEAAQRYRRQLRDAASTGTAPPAASPLSVFYLLWEPPLYTAGGGSLIDQAITRCGGRNIFAALNTPAPIVSTESVLKEKPQVIVIGGSPDNFTRWKKQWQHWPQIPAVRDQAFVRIDPDLLHRPGPRFAEGVETLCRALQRSRAAAEVP